MNDKEKIYLRAYLNENLGDDLFIQIVSKRYPKHIFTIFAGERYRENFPENVRCELTMEDLKKIQKSSSFFKWLYKSRICRKLIPSCWTYENRRERKLIKQADYNIYVIGSGFMEGGQIKFWDYWNLKFYFKRAVYLIGCNFGPYQTEKYKRIYKKLFAMAKDVCFRETYSYELFKELKQVRQAQDIVFTYDLEEDMELADQLGDYIVISVVNLAKDNNRDESECEYIKFIQSLAQIYMEKNKKIVFVGFCKNQGDDLAITKIIDKLGDSELITTINYPDIDHSKIMGVFKNASAVISSRYHAAIIALLYQKPTYFIAYSNKTVNVIQDIDKNIKYIETHNLKSITPQIFIDEYKYIMSNELLDKLKKSAQQQFTVLDELLK